MTSRFLSGAPTKVVREKFTSTYWKENTEPKLNIRSQLRNKRHKTISNLENVFTELEDVFLDPILNDSAMDEEKSEYC